MKKLYRKGFVGAIMLSSVISVFNATNVQALAQNTSITFEETENESLCESILAGSALAIGGTLLVPTIYHISYKKEEKKGKQKIK